jgi:hypothetical protein
LKEIIKNTNKGRCPLCSSEVDVKHIPLDWLKTRNRRTKFLSEKWLNMNKEVAYRKI